MSEQLRVYCGECEHRFFAAGGPDDYGTRVHLCALTAMVKSSAIKGRLVYTMCEVRNAGNDCVEFERRRPVRRRIADWFLRRVRTDGALSVSDQARERDAP